MRTAESDQKNQQTCEKCGRVVGCDYNGRKHKCNCIDGKYYCESCSQLKADVTWWPDIEQYECEECYQVWQAENLM